MKDPPEKPLSKGQLRRMKKRSEKRAYVRWILAAGILVVVAALISTSMRPAVEKGKNPVAVHSERRPSPEYAVFRAPDYAKDHSFDNEAVLVWGGDHQYTDGLRQNKQLSNIRRSDYAGQDSCRECHAENYENWSKHSHRWMNALANEESVKGDFSGAPRAKIDYWGGTGEFYREHGNYMVKLARDGVVREFKVNRTLGSRVHQYYIGKLQTGPESDDHEYRTTDHVLPFGYELTMKEWVPIVHATGQQGPDSKRDDPFEIPSRLAYDTGCSMCHTTPPMGNLMLAMFKRFAAYSPRKIHFEGSNYIDEVHPGAVRLGLKKTEQFTPQNVQQHINELANQSQRLMHQDNAVDLGIACEACHLGAKAHADNEKIRPPFFPSGPYVFASGADDEEIWGKTSANKNFICARCHSGSRPQYAAGISTWNSTEYTDAMRGHCYHPDKAAARGMESLTCVSCHSPHEAIGRHWTKTPAANQLSCVACHTQYGDNTMLQQHTHHAGGSSGSQCMNCHMPKINEGLGDMVRTHTIFNPTNVKMLEANQPNACNMCHVDKSIDWTLKYLAQWYGLSSDAEAGNNPGKTYSIAAIAENYSDRAQPAPLGWLQSPHSATRLVGADVLLKSKAASALPQVLQTLDDPYMENRQFTVQRLRDYFDIDPSKYGYKHYMTKPERQQPLGKLLEAFTSLGDGNERH